MFKKGQVPWNKGKSLSLEHRLNLSIAAQKWVHNPKVLKRIGDAHREARNNRWVAKGLRTHHGRYYVRLVSGWIVRAHAVWVQQNGPIPNPGLGLRFDNYNVHHKDENMLNDSIDNLELITCSVHQRLRHQKRGVRYA